MNRHGFWSVPIAQSRNKCYLNEQEPPPRLRPCCCWSMFLNLAKETSHFDSKFRVSCTIFKCSLMLWKYIVSTQNTSSYVRTVLIHIRLHKYIDYLRQESRKSNEEKWAILTKFPKQQLLLKRLKYTEKGNRKQRGCTNITQTLQYTLANYKIP